MVSKKILIIVVACAFLGGGLLVYFFARNNYGTFTVISQPSSDSAANTRAPRKAICDGPSSIAPGDLYSKRSVAFTDASGTMETLADECTADFPSRVNKTYCYENPYGSGNFVPGKVAYDCPLGCADGACKKAEVSSTFNYPYPVSWTEGGASFSLTGATLGNVSVPADAATGNGSGPATSAYALTFLLKISTGNSPQCIPVNMRQLLNEQGDLGAPMNSRFDFPDTRGAQFIGFCPAPNITYTAQKVIFPASENQNQFEFTTGGTSNIFFSVTVNASGTIQLQQEAQNG